MFFIHRKLLCLYRTLKWKIIIKYNKDFSPVERKIQQQLVHKILEQWILYKRCKYHKEMQDSVSLKYLRIYILFLIFFFYQKNVIFSFNAMNEKPESQQNYYYLMKSVWGKRKMHGEPQWKKVQKKIKSPKNKNHNQEIGKSTVRSTICNWR